MVNTSSNEIWKNSDNYRPFELRSYRFREDMLPLFYKWLGIQEGSHILDAGCGTGVFGRYLASGFDNVHVTGFDISEAFIEYGKRRLVELGLDKKVSLQVDDGFALSFPDNSFDTVTNYTYIGVLSDPVAGLRELIRVCKPGGIISCVVATYSNISWQGDYPFDGADELQMLSRTEFDIYTRYARKASDFNQSIEWPEYRYPKMFEVCGLNSVKLYPFAYTINYSDETLPLEYRRSLLLDEVEEEIKWLESRYTDKHDIYANHGFDKIHYTRLVELLNTKLNYIKEHFKNDKSFEWRGGFNFIVTGTK